MDDFNYSLDALNVINVFHSAEYMVYVEGDDDEYFWKSIFELANIKGYYIESAGGAEELNKKIHDVVNNNTKAIIAKDCDYSIYLDNKVNHPLIVETYGYSIENSLYCPITINNIISKVSRKITDVINVIDDWYSKLVTTIKDLLLLDICSIKYCKGISVLGDSCHQYLLNNKSPSLSKTKIDNKHAEIQAQFTPDQILSVEKLVRKDKRIHRYIIRGHFITLAAINLIKTLSKNITGNEHKITKDNIYVMTVGACSSCAQKCIDIKNTIRSLNGAHRYIQTI